MLEPFPAKPKGIHRRTFRRLRARAEAACRLLAGGKLKRKVSFSR